MPKALCIVGLVVSLLVALIFLVDLILPFAGMGAWAPFGSDAMSSAGIDMALDVTFIVCALILGYLSWSTLREQ